MNIRIQLGTIWDKEQVVYEWLDAIVPLDDSIKASLRLMMESAVVYESTDLDIDHYEYDLVNEYLYTLSTLVIEECASDCTRYLMLDTHCTVFTDALDMIKGFDQFSYGFNAWAPVFNSMHKSLCHNTLMYKIGDVKSICDIMKYNAVHEITVGLVTTTSTIIMYLKE